MVIVEPQLEPQPTLILLHGATLNGHMWDPIRRHLNPGYRILAPDLPGHGVRRHQSFELRRGALEAALFATNLFDKRYFESYIDGSALAAAGLPRPLISNLGLEGDRRRVGLRAAWRF
jgi:pimeloyl-ACP methyl ester carboxylesterase